MYHNRSHLRHMNRLFLEISIWHLHWEVLAPASLLTELLL